jgi:hypothetical protein
MLDKPNDRIYVIANRAKKGGLKMKWNDLQNEGGEGYGPTVKKDNNIPHWVVLSGQRDRILKIMESVSTDDSRYAQYTLDLAAIEAEIKKEG